MGLVINHNMAAQTAQNNLSATYRKLSESVNALSSGLRINSADDDAAGLAVREYMRSQIAALDQGVRNANDAISMLQTFDGAAQVIDEKLIRMKELAEQAATDSYNSSQRTIMNNEFSKMADEIDRIAEATEFNGIKGLDASGSLTVHFGPGNTSAEDYYDVTKQNLHTGSAQAVATDAGATLTVADGSAFSVGERVLATDADGNTTQQVVLAISGNDITLDADPFGGTAAASVEASGTGSGVDGTLASALDTFDNESDPKFTEGWVEVDDASVFEEGDSVTLTAVDTGNAKLGEDNSVTVTGVNTDQNKIYLEDVDNTVDWDGSESTAIGAAYITVNDGGTGGTGLGLSQVDISTRSNAQSALEALDTAIATKDAGRAHFGAMINRLKSTVAATEIQRENLQAAESQISDADVASEMARLTKNQVLAQAGIAALAQANSIPQMALSLLGG